MKFVQITAQGLYLYGLTEDGRVFKYSEIQRTWDEIPTPSR